MWGYIIAGIAILCNIFFVLKYKKCLLTKAEALSNEMSERIINSVPDMIFMVDHHFRIKKIYNSEKNNLSVPEQELIGRSLKDCIDPEYAKTVLNDIQRALDSDEVFEAEYSITVNGKKRFFEGRFKRVQKKLVACFERDITERKKSETEIKQNESLLSSVLDNMPMPLIIKDIDDNLKYIFWNKQCENQGGYTRDDIVGKTDIEIYGDERGFYYQNIDRKIIAGGGSYRNQEIYITPNGERHTSIVNKNIISNDIHNWLLATRWDITDLIQIQEQLQEANRQLNLAFSATSTVPVMWDIESDIIQFKYPEFKKRNKGFQTERNGLESTTILSHVHPDDREKLAKGFDGLKSGTIENFHIELRYDILQKFEEFYDVYLTIEKKDSTGKTIRVIGTMRKITDRKLYEQQLLEAKKSIEKIQEMNQLILDHSNSGLVYLTPDFTVQWENLSKYTKHPLGERYKAGICCYKNVMGQNEPCPGCAVQKVLLSGKKTQKETSFPDGTIAEITGTPVIDNESGKIRGIVLKFDDVTENRKAALDLKKAKEAAETSDRLKSMFLSNMSHEIRTPLNAIVGFSELLAHSDESDEKEEYVNIINRNNELLLQLINDILDLSKIEANTLEFVYSTTDINNMLKNLELSTHHKVENNPELEINFIPQLAECHVYTEPNRLHQVISNLINNALKFTDKGYIRFGYEVIDSGLRFFVSDTGKGIPAEKQKDIFKRFIKLDNFKSGTGLGLAICETILHKLNGEIGVESEDGKGSTFWFTLPVKPINNDTNNEATAEEAKTEIKEKKTEADSSTKNNPTLLIAEDNPDNFKLYNTLLGKKYTLLHAWNGKEAVAIYERYSPDIIIMDIKMPEMDGYEATAVIREKDADIPIIAASAYAFAEDVERIMNSGFSDYISKPIKYTELEKVLKLLK